MNPALALLRKHPALWGSPAERRGLPTGFGALDRLLPGGGWPLGALTEILAAREGVGELGLLLPALARLGREGRLAVWVAPPHLPYGPALAAAGVSLARLLVVQPPAHREALWAAEQALRSRACGAVLAWVEEDDGRPGARRTGPPTGLDRSLRRLQLAAEGGGGLGVLFRPPGAAAQPSPAALRLAVEPDRGGTLVRVLKGRGSGRGEVLLARGDLNP